MHARLYSKMIASHSSQEVLFIAPPLLGNYLADFTIGNIISPRSEKHNQIRSHAARC